MRLLLHRSQSEHTGGLTSSITFTLWAKFEVTEEERALLTRYRVHDAILWEGDPHRDLIRASRYGAVLAILVGVLAFSFLPGAGLGRSLLLAVVAFAVLSWAIYQQIREEVRVGDILIGRPFTCRSVVMLMEKERTITEMGVVFRRFLEAMQTWGGAEVIDIEPEQEKPTVRVIERGHAAA